MAENDVLPYFYLQQLDGSFLESCELTGKHTYIHFWSFWCKPCLELFPYENQITDELFKEVNFVNICIDCDSARWANFSKKKISKNSINLRATENWNSKIKSDYSIKALPRTLIADAKLRIIDLNPELPTMGLKEQLEKIINISEHHISKN